MTTTEIVPGSGAMFDQIAARYDLMNRVLSFGRDRAWRRATASALALGDGPAHVVDVATGTGDLAIDIAKRWPAATVIGIDPSHRMLGIGRLKVAARGLDRRIELAAGDALGLTLPDASTDGATIAFGLRNLPDRARGLAELARVVRPGGRVCILELAEPKNPFARFHVHRVAPRLGALISGGSQYRYLSRSIAAFPPGDVVASMMTDAGLDVAEIRPLTFGVCTLFVGVRR
jgi:demethylmenaquinone methyltransferase / 2-methoxy-6-polyprenyl-1,4-benzoquinol methylase